MNQRTWKLFIFFIYITIVCNHFLHHLTLEGLHNKHVSPIQACEYMWVFVSNCTQVTMLADTSFGSSKAPVTEALSHHSTYQWITTSPILTQLFAMKEQAALAVAPGGRNLLC